jgi:hypothetical protein
MVCFTWNKHGENVFVTGSFNSYNLLRLDSGDDYLSKQIKEKRATVWVNPGKIYYLFVVDGKEICDKLKPYEE